jgi:hypothetical protein
MIERRREVLARRAEVAPTPVDPVPPWVAGSGRRPGPVSRRHPIAARSPRCAASPQAGDVYSEAVKESLDVETAKKASLEQRSFTVITTSGVIVSLLLGFLAVLAKRDQENLPLMVKIALTAAVVAFLLVSMFALRANSPQPYAFLSSEDMLRMVTADLWDRDKSVAARRIAENRVAQVIEARKRNERKAADLKRAIPARASRRGLRRPVGRGPPLSRVVNQWHGLKCLVIEIHQ